MSSGCGGGLEIFPGGLEPFPHGSARWLGGQGRVSGARWWGRTFGRFIGSSAGGAIGMRDRRSFFDSSP